MPKWIFNLTPVGCWDEDPLQYMIFLAAFSLKLILDYPGYEKYVERSEFCQE